MSTTKSAAEDIRAILETIDNLSVDETKLDEFNPFGIFKKKPAANTPAPVPATPTPTVATPAPAAPVATPAAPAARIYNPNFDKTRKGITDYLAFVHRNIYGSITNDPKERRNAERVLSRLWQMANHHNDPVADRIEKVCAEYHLNLEK